MTITMVFVPNLKEIAGLTLKPNGLVRKWHRTIMRESASAAFALSPKQTMELATSFKVKAGAVSPTRSTFTLENSAYHARFVFAGTTGPIRSSHPGKAMAVGLSQVRRGVPRPVFWARQVRGQRANNVPMRAVADVLRLHGVL